MPFKLSDWIRMLLRLELARDHVNKFRALPPAERTRNRHFLDDAINAIHAVAEYAVNVHLELRGQLPETTNDTGTRVKELRTLGYLAGDYTDVLEQLERYRKFAQYAGYGRSGSTHYNATNVETCLAAVDGLVEETKAALQTAGKLVAP